MEAWLTFCYTLIGGRASPGQVVAQGDAVTNDYVIVSAPGKDAEKGSVYVYTYVEATESWRMLQTITSELWSLGEGLSGTAKGELYLHVGRSISCCISRVTAPALWRDVTCDQLQRVLPTLARKW